MGAEQDKFLEAAYGIGIKLSRNAIWSGNKCNWVGPSMEFLDNTWKVVQRSFGTDLYSGTSGIGYFLSFLYSQTQDNIIKKTALGCFEQCLANLEQTPANARIGLYTGWSGVVKALQVCGPLLGITEFEKQASLLVDSLMQSNLEESGIDVLAGSAGAIPVYVSQMPEDSGKYISFAKQIADYLIEIVHKTEKGWSWNTLDIHSKDHSADLTGFSHGTAGIAWTLMELYYVTKEEKYNDAAQKAFEYERSWFDPKYGNWPDLRNKNENTNAASLYGSVAWCHGAPGIGLSRLRAYDLSGGEVYKKEAEVAIGTTHKMINQSLQTGQMNFSLCHGLSGNAELLIMAGMSLKNTDFISYSQEVGDAGIKLYTNTGHAWPCGIMGAGELPGLMLGIAGIGLFYLRLYDRVHIPSILILNLQA